MVVGIQVGMVVVGGVGVTVGVRVDVDVSLGACANLHYLES